MLGSGSIPRTVYDMEHPFEVIPRLGECGY